MNLTVNVGYAGGSGLNGLIIVDWITLHYNEGSITTKLTNPIEIKGPVKVTIPITKTLSKRLIQK